MATAIAEPNATTAHTGSGNCLQQAACKKSTELPAHLQEEAESKNAFADAADCPDGRSFPATWTNRANRSLDAAIART